MNGNKRAATASILVAAVFWGSIGIFFRYLSAMGFDRSQLLAIRVTVALVMLAAVMLVGDKRMFAVRLKDIWIFAGSGLLSFVVMNLCYYTCLSVAEMAVAGVLLYTAPVFVTLMSAVIFGERITPLKTAVLICTFAGCVLISGMAGGAKLAPLGIISGIGSGFAYALYSIFGRLAIDRGYNSRTISFYTFAFAAAAAIPLGGPALTVRMIAENAPLAVFLAVGLGFFTCFIPYILYTYGLTAVEPGRASVMATLEPLSGALFGLLFFNERPDAFKLAGMALIIGAVAVLAMQPQDQKDGKA